MAKAIWNGVVLAECSRTQMVEGNHYFPPDTVNWHYLQDSPRHTVCPWKGQASYYTIVVDGQENPNAAWYYPEPKPAASHIKDHVAFWHGVTIEP